MVRTPGFHPGNRGSIPRATTLFGSSPFAWLRRYDVKSSDSEKLLR
ncbi:MAG: hypothetical protein ACD_43C00083G0001, partial [uncultured bacterium]